MDVEKVDNCIWFTIDVAININTFLVCRERAEVQVQKKRVGVPP